MAGLFLEGSGEQESGREDRLRGNPDRGPQLAVGGLGQAGGPRGIWQFCLGSQEAQDSPKKNNVVYFMTSLQDNRWPMLELESQYQPFNSSRNKLLKGLNQHFL